MILKKRISLAIISLTIFVFSIALGVVLSVILPVNATPNDRPIIIIDAGHGGLTNTTH